MFADIVEHGGFTEAGDLFLGTPIFVFPSRGKILKSRARGDKSGDAINFGIGEFAVGAVNESSELAGIYEEGLGRGGRGCL